MKAGIALDRLKWSPAPVFVDRPDTKKDVPSCAAEVVVSSMNGVQCVSCTSDLNLLKDVVS